MKIRKLLFPFLWCLVLAGIGVTLGFVSRDQNGELCKGINTVVRGVPAVAGIFVEKEDVDSIIIRKFGILKGKSMRQISVENIELILRNNPLIAEANVYVTIDGFVNVDVKQRTPSVRVMNMEGESFYIDETGAFMPLSDKGSARLLVVNGYVYDNYRQRTAKILDVEDTVKSGKYMMDTIFTLAKYISSEPFLNAEIQQIYINEEREIELVPYVGKHIIVLGDISDMKEKFKRLQVFYQKGLSKAGWNVYNTINLKYKNQVVCSK